MAYTKPAKGTPGGAKYGSYTLFGKGMPTHAKEQKGASAKEGAGLWGLGFDPEDPTVDAQVEAWLAKHQRPDGTYIDNKGNPSNWMNQVTAIRNKYPNIRPSAAVDAAMRGQLFESSKPPKNFFVDYLMDPLVETIIGSIPFLGPPAAAIYGGARTASQGGDLFDVALSAYGGYGAGSMGSGISSGISAAGGPMNYLSGLGKSGYNAITNLPSTIGNVGKDFTNYLKYGGPELTDVNATFATRAPWVASGAAAGASNASRALGAGLTAGKLTAGGQEIAGPLLPGSSASAGGSNMALGWGEIGKLAVDIGLPLYQAAQTNKSIKEGVKAQTQAVNQGLAEQRAMFDKAVELNKPWQEAGANALARQQLLLGLGPTGQGTAEYGSLNKPFSMAAFQQDPGYAFRLAEGQKALERSAAARGGLLSGGTGKALTQYGQDMASQEYQNAFNRYYKEREAILNPLQSLSGLGQTTASQLGGAGQEYGKAAAQTGVDLATLNAKQNIAGNYLRNDLLNTIVNRVSAYGP